MWKEFPCHDVFMNVRPNGAYHQTSNIKGTLESNKIVDHSDVVGALPAGTAPTTSSFSTQHLASMDWVKASARRDQKHLSVRIWCAYVTGFIVIKHCCHPCSFLMGIIWLT